MLRDAYKLSKGWVRAQSGIVMGLSAGQIAEQAARSKETIRSRIKGLYAKTATGSMADILRLVHQCYRM